jgi:hypothetical protein
MAKQEFVEKLKKAGDFIGDRSIRLAEAAKRKAVEYTVDFKEKHDYVFGKELLVDGFDGHIGQNKPLTLVYRKKAQKVKEFAAELIDYGKKANEPESILLEKIVRIQVGCAITNLEELISLVARTDLLKDPKEGYGLAKVLNGMRGSTKYLKDERKKTLVDYVL